MARGATPIILSAALCVAGCASTHQELKIRPVGGTAQQARPVSEQLAYARGQLLMGSPGLALESFRKALRDDPDNAAALAGIADSYAAMGRSDLARRYYETALAFVPKDPVLLQAVAEPTRPEAPAVGSVTVALPPAKPVSAFPQAQPGLAQAADEAFAPLDTAEPTRGVAATEEPRTAPAAAVTVKLPPARPAKLPPVIPAAPRLERMSPNEVALVTTGRPVWASLHIGKPPAKAAERLAVAAKPPIRLLNAARRQGLAAGTRQTLSASGWRNVAIGDARQVRDKSIIFFPAHQEGLARVLAWQVGARAMKSWRGNSIVVLLGRDSVRAGRART